MFQGEINPIASTSKKSSFVHRAPELSELVGELVPVSNWFELGLYLRVDPDALKQIEADYPHSTVRRKSEVLHHWLNNDPDASWEKLVAALRKMGGYKKVADQIYEKYCIQGDDSKGQYYHC